jgi:dolichol-phosphate mannosyltransferase
MDAVSPELSIVIPCYNERENVGPLLERLREVLEPLRRTYELIVTDDASTDGTWDELVALAPRYPMLRIQRFAGNCGQSAALEAGLRRARGKVIVTLDADLQNDPQDLPKLLEALEGCDCAVGSRAAARREGYGLMRVVSSLIANSIRNSITGDSFSDSGCNFRAMRRECVERIPFFNGAHRFLPTLLQMEGFRVAEVPIAVRPRLHGKSKYGVGNRALRGLRDCLGVRWMKKRSYRYRVVEERNGRG